MKKKYFLLITGLACFTFGLVNGCKKDPLTTHIGTTTSFAEEFENVYQLETKGWVIKDNSNST